MLKEIKGAGSGGETVCRWFCCAAASVVLLGFGPAGYRQITGAKLILFYTVWGSFLAALCAC